MAEEFVNDYAAVVEQIGQRFDKTDHTLDEHTRTLSLHGQQLASISRKLDEQEVEFYDMRAILRQHSRDISEIKTRLGKMDARLGELDGKLDQVIALLRKPGE